MTTAPPAPVYRNVTIERMGPVALVTFNRRGSLNAFNQETILELTDVARRFQEDIDTQAVVLTGAPEAFSAGIDLRDTATWETLDSDVATRERFYRGVRLCQAWEDMPQVTIAAMEKLAVGAGCAIALACDWRVLARDAYLYVPEVKIGLNLQWGALPRLITLVGPARAKRIVLLCERMAAKQAQDWGLVDELAEPGGATTTALALARTAAGLPAATTRMVKQAINATANALHKSSAFADADQSALSRAYRDAVAARAAFGAPPAPFELHPQLAADCAVVGDLPLSRVLLMNDRRYFWCILVPRQADRRELHDLSAADGATLFAEIDQVSRAVQRLDDAHKINVGALGNKVPQLHVHVLGRHPTDAAWPGPVWGVGSAEPYEGDDLARRLQDLRAALELPG
ncbi:MAG: enoyl-CoA hydratase-related protein [Gammaproteobacteria bacterium]